MERTDTAGLPVVEMPLFPLNVVLFPHMPLPLHIFEERYKEMIHRCLHDSSPFGVVLIAEGSERRDDARIREIGCAARVSHVERLADGRMIVLVVGETRFRVLDTHESLSYRTGITLPFSDALADAAAVVPLADEVQKLLREFLTHSLAIAGQQAGEFDLPDEPEQLSFTAACVLPLDNEEKQALLEGTDTAARLGREREILLGQVMKLRRAAAQSAPEPITADCFAPFRCSN